MMASDHCVKRDKNAFIYILIVKIYEYVMISKILVIRLNVHTIIVNQNCIIIVILNYKINNLAYYNYLIIY